MAKNPFVGQKNNTLLWFVISCQTLPKLHTVVPQKLPHCRIYVVSFFTLLDSALTLIPTGQQKTIVFLLILDLLVLWGYWWCFSFGPYAKVLGTTLYSEKIKIESFPSHYSPAHSIKATFPGSLLCSSSALAMWAEIYGEDKTQFHFKGIHRCEWYEQKATVVSYVSPKLLSLWVPRKQKEHWRLCPTNSPSNACIKQHMETLATVSSLGLTIKLSFSPCDPLGTSNW